MWLCGSPYVMTAAGRKKMLVGFGSFLASVTFESRKNRRWNSIFIYQLRQLEMPGGETTSSQSCSVFGVQTLEY